MKKKSIKKISRYAMYSLLLSIAAAFLVFSVLVIVDWVKANVMAKEQLYEYAESFTLEKNYSEETHVILMTKHQPKIRFKNIDILPNCHFLKPISKN